MAEDQIQQKATDFVQDVLISKKFTEFVEARKQFEPFRMMGIHRKETIHSRILAHFLRRKSQNKKDDFFNQFISLCESKELLYKNCEFSFNADKVSKRKITTEYSFDQQKTPEKKNSNFIDVLVSYDDTVIAIENKLDAKEGDKQLQRYQKYLNERPETNKLIIFLTRTGHLPLTHLAEIQKNQCNILVLSWLEVIHLVEQIAPDIQNELEHAYLKILINHFNINFKMKSEIEEECLRLFEQKPEVYKMIVDNYNKCARRNTEKLFQTIVERLRGKSHLDLDPIKPEVDPQAINGKGSFVLNIRDKEWPKGLYIKIYRHFAFGVFPFICKEYDEEKLKGLRGVDLTRAFIGQNIAYFLHPLFAEKEEKQNETKRFVRKDGEFMNEKNVEEAILRFMKYHDDINQILAGKVVTDSIETEGN